MRDLSSIFPVVVCVLVLAFNPARADDDKETLKKITELQSKVIQLQDENSKLKEELAGLKSPSAKSKRNNNQSQNGRTKAIVSDAFGKPSMPRTGARLG